MADGDRTRNGFPAFCNSFSVATSGGNHFLTKRIIFSAEVAGIRVHSVSIPHLSIVLSKVHS